MRTTTWLTLAAATLLAGCSSTGKGLSVSATTRGASTPPAASATVASIDAGHGLSIDRLRVLVKKVEVEGAACGVTGPTGPTGPGRATGTAAGAGARVPVVADGHGGSSGGDSRGDDGSGDDSSGDDGSGNDGSDEDGGECEIEGGPFLVDLGGDALTGGVHWVAGLDVPAGTYREVKFQINTLSSSGAGGDPGLQAMAEAHASILVDGTRTTTVDGAPVVTPFTFAVSIEVAQRREGTIVVDAATGANVTLDVDPSGWFKAADGALLDPSDATARGAILANIRASIRLLHDDDDDGDHGPGPN